MVLLKGDKMRKPITTKLNDYKKMKTGDETVIIMIRNGYGSGTRVPTKKLKNKGVGEAILNMLDETLKEAGKVNTYVIPKDI